MDDIQEQRIKQLVDRFCEQVPVISRTKIEGDIRGALAYFKVDDDMRAGVIKDIGLIESILLNL